ncbi:TPA: CHRD domain-containing protein [Bacillus cereus]|uniref:CHRD domain-containing protein n=1 Tax=Bacillus cereus TaxID=1396 RepID=UPI000A302A06|nr:CHRD domain-containing protein [Bacillus cereus]SMD61309.1 CHRD domain protein [Bacillus cereus]HDR8089038.1 CHRD domain-containing protein [Bacillus cereus]HDR8302707.1 CHRD domain-containing protein [Bacillus cereus]HDR8319707.1 CHRD domain-containing protein [Bacillus cereus]HDR8325964.1 CHRD domain-containing protein [Bacillus cereus]
MFFAKLRGRNEVPPVETDARGQAFFKLSRDELSLKFKLELFNLENVVVAHLHLGAKGTNGPVVAFLFGPITNPVSIECATFTGIITQEDLVGPLAGQTLDALVNEIIAGNIYINVHTVQHPTGEIRGQLYHC